MIISLPTVLLIDMPNLLIDSPKLPLSSSCVRRSYNLFLFIACKNGYLLYLLSSAYFGSHLVKKTKHESSHFMLISCA